MLRYWANTGDDIVHLPAAPLRIYRFTSAGGRAAEICPDSGQPRGCVFKVGFTGGNPYDGKVVLMDEGHHLVRPSSLYETQLSNLRKLVRSAQHSVFVCLTGSMADSASDAGDLLKVVKGSGNEGLTDEGFLSSHCRRGASFPTQRPAACADGVLSEECDGLMHREELVGYSLARYMYQSIKLHKEKKPSDGLACYANIHCYVTAVGNATCKHQLMHHDSCRPKFTAAVSDVVAAAKLQQKSMVMVSKRTGYKVMLWLLEAAGKRHKFNVARPPHVKLPFWVKPPVFTKLLHQSRQFSMNGSSSGCSLWPPGWLQQKWQRPWREIYGSSSGSRGRGKHWVEMCSVGPLPGCGLDWWHSSHVNGLPESKLWLQVQSCHRCCAGKPMSLDAVFLWVYARVGSANGSMTTSEFSLPHLGLFH